MTAWTETKAPFSLLVVLLLSAACATTPKVDSYVGPPEGSTWVHAFRESGSYGTANEQRKFTMGRQSWDGRTLLAFQGPRVTTLAVPGTGNWVAWVQGTTPVVSWDPPVGWTWPLEVGKTMTSSTTITLHESGRKVPNVVTFKVESYEEVTVPAGTFKAFKVTSSDTLGHQGVVWWSPELGVNVKTRNERTAKHRQGPGVQEIEMVSHAIKK